MPPPEPPSLASLAARIDALEARADFRHDLVERLDAVIVRQQQQIDTLLRELARLAGEPPVKG